MQHVVLIQKSDIRRFGNGYAVIAGCRTTGVFLVDKPKTGIFVGKAFDDCFGAVLRAVIDAKDFKIAETLTGNRLQTGYEIFSALYNGIIKEICGIDSNPKVILLLKSIIRFLLVQ